MTLMDTGFVTLSDGKVHYELAGHPNRDTVVLVHGLTTPMFVWDRTFEALVNAGFNVLRYDLYGRGKSAKPQVEYTLDLFSRQLRHLLHMLNLDKPVHMVGVSMGGGIATHFAALHPERVKKLCLISPAGLPMEVPWSARLLNISGVGDLLVKWLGKSVILRSMEKNFHDQSEVPDFKQKFIPQLEDPNYAKAILSTLRNFPLDNLVEHYQTVGKSEHPILLFWGKQDRILPFSNGETLKTMIPQLQFEPVDEAGHISHYEKPDFCNPIMIKFLKDEKSEAFI